MKLFSRSNGELIMVCLIANALGCGSSDRHSIGIDATVRVDNQPLASGTVTLTPTDGGSGRAMSTSITNGSFRFDVSNGPTSGTYQATVTSAERQQTAERSDESASQNKAEMQITPRQDKPVYRNRRSRSSSKQRQWNSKIEVGQEPIQSVMLSF
jgi:hypothetical protein